MILLSNSNIFKWYSGRDNSNKSIQSINIFDEKKDLYIFFELFPSSKQSSNSKITLFIFLFGLDTEFLK